MDVVVMGAGAAGLAASCKLARAGLRVAVIEARERAGGRIFSVAGAAPLTASTPFELGAEFIHGSKNAVTEICRRAELRTFEAQGRHWNLTQTGLTPERTLWKKLEECLRQVKPNQADVSFDELLRRQSLTPHDDRMLRLYVEGFDAADPARISSQALARAEEEDKTLRVHGGYGRLVDWLRATAENAGAKFWFSTVAQTVSWRRGKVEIAAQTAAGRHVFRAPQAIITLPLGVLKSGAVRFVPELRAKRDAIAGLEMGNVVKVSLVFGTRFWSKQIGFEDFGFIHGPQLTFPTWWSRKRAPLLTAWIGGPPAARLDTSDLPGLALRDARRIFKLPLPLLSGELRDWRFYDWQRDPFARGAYSYTVVGNVGAPEALGEPLEKTLIFAGEATVSGAAQGTVHGAVASGLRAAGQILEQTMRFKSDRIGRSF